MTDPGLNAELPGRLCVHKFARGKGDSVEIRRDQQPGTIHKVDVWVVYLNRVAIDEFTSPADAYRLMDAELNRLEEIEGERE